MKEPVSPRDMRSADDEVLVALLHNDVDGATHRLAAGELLGRYQRRIYVWCLRMVRDHDQALDLAQDVQLSAYRALGSFRSSSRFSSWLFAIARNRCLSALRPVSLTRDEEAEMDSLPHPQRGPERALEEEQEEEGLLQLMRECLEPVEQQALALRCFERMSVDEITRQLELDNATGARGLLQKARRKLRAALAARSERRTEQ